MNETTGIQPTYNLAERSNDGFGGGAWFWIVIVLIFMGGGFWGNNGNQNGTLEREFIQRDIFNTNQNVSNLACSTQRDVLENRYASALGFKDQLYAQQQCCCETNRNIDSVKAEAYRNTCDITTAIREEGNQTRALISAQAMQDLRDRLEERDRQLMTANFQLSQQAQTASIVTTLQPTPKPAYLTNSPYFAYGYNGCGCQGCGNI